MAGKKGFASCLFFPDFDLDESMRITETLQVLSDSTRLRMLRLLAQEELSVAELQEILEMGQSRISSHLGLLRRHDMVSDRKDGKKTYYNLTMEVAR
ncbi:MAG: metalloregulator ArsR/SmtB family transcription factor, partial [Opitutae bacterium]